MAQYRPVRAKAVKTTSNIRFMGEGLQKQIHLPAQYMPNQKGREIERAAKMMCVLDDLRYNV